MDLVIMGKMDNGKSAPADLLKTATMKSLNEEVVKVIGGTKLMAVGLGVADVEIKIGSTTKVVKITVNDTTEAELTYISLSQKAVSLPEGVSVKFIFGGEGMANKTIAITGMMSNGQAASGAMLQSAATFESNNASVTVDPNGAITAAAEGTAQVKVKVGAVETTFTVNVQAATLSSLSLDQSSVTVSVGDTITPTF